MKRKIVITGGEGRLAKHFKPYQNSFKIEFAKKKELDILNVKKISKYLNKIKPKYLIHNAALSRPMDIHEDKIQNSITKNISRVLFIRNGYICGDGQPNNQLTSNKLSELINA